MLTKGNDSKVQNEVMAQIVADTSAKWMKFTRLLPKQEIEENSQYYTYMSQRVNIEEAIQSGVLGEAKDIAPGATLQELNIRKPISETISIDTIGGVLNVSAQMLDSNLISVNDMLQDVGSTQLSGYVILSVYVSKSSKNSDAGAVLATSR